MDRGSLLFLTTFGAASVLFGLWLRPIWRRVRRERLKRTGGLTLSLGRARERLLWVNAFGSIALGGVLLGVVQMELGSYLKEQAIAQERSRFSFGCTRGQLTVPLRIEGPLRHPRVTPDPAFAASVARGLLPSGTVGDAVGSALEQLLGGKRRGGR